MRDFWSDNRKTVGKLMLNQFGAAFMGLMITSAVTKTPWLMLFGSVFSVIFYLVLIYNVIWERGGQDRIRVDGGRAARKPWQGLWVALAANALSIVLGILILIGKSFGETQLWAGNLYAVCNVISRLWNAMYIGIIQTYSPNNPIIHLLHVIPAFVVIAGGYWLGYNNVRLFGFLSPKKTKK